MTTTSKKGLKCITATYKLCMILLLVGLPTPLISGPPTSEDKLKVALIYKLTKFVEWPAHPVDHSRKTFGICLLGEDPFGDALNALGDRNVKGRSISVHRHSQSEAIDEQCQIVFISDSKRPFLDPILQSLQARPILTLSDMEQFAEQGGILQLSRGEKRIGFVINLNSAKQSQLTIAAPLLDLASVIQGVPKITNQ